MEAHKNVFVIMPFSATTRCSEEEWTDIFHNVFKKSIEEIGYSCERIVPNRGSLIKSIIHKLKMSPIVLADITDNNPNVFYELGVRHSLSKRTILVSQDPDNIPSDLNGFWTLTYNIYPNKIQQFKNEIKTILKEIEENPNKIDSPVSEYLQNEQYNVDNYLIKESAKKLTALYTELTGDVIYLLNYVKDSEKNAIPIPTICLDLLLSTLYIDLGPDILKELYEIRHQLRIINNRMMLNRLARHIKIVLDTENKIRNISNKILEIRNKLILGQYTEPPSLSTMIWGNHKTNWNFFDHDSSLSFSRSRHNIACMMTPCKLFNCFDEIKNQQYGKTEIDYPIVDYELLNLIKKSYLFYKMKE